MALSTEKVTIVAAVAFVVTPFASLSVAVTIVLCPAIAGKADCARVALIDVGAPGPVKVTFTVQPVSVGKVGEFEESWSVPVLADEAGAVRVKVPTPLTTVTVAEASAVPPLRVAPRPPAWDSVTLVLLSPVTVLPAESWTVTVTVDVVVD